MNRHIPSFLKKVLLATALLSAGHVYAANADSIVVYNAQHESLTKAWAEAVGKNTQSNPKLVPLQQLDAPTVDASKLDSKKAVELMTQAGLL
jgi:hypothetical protein